MKPATLYLPALALATSTLAAPHGVEHELVRTERTVQSTLRSAWNSIVSSTFGWYDLPTVFEDTIAHIEGVLDEPQKSVWQTLKADDQFYNLTRLIEHDKDIKKILDGASHGLTFFAPDNEALKPPRRRKDIFDIHASHDDALSHLSAFADELERGGDDDDDDDKERKKRIFKKILHAVLSYHILPANVGAVDIGLNSTVATNLLPEDGSMNGQARRIKVERSLVPPTVLLNKYVKVKKGDIYATNGIIHSIDHPLIPPPSILDIAFFGATRVSTFTSALQKVGLQDALQWKYVHSKDGLHALDFEGSPTVTAFVPTNDAFKALPERLLIYLFSPFGERALRKLLQFHVVPDFIVHTEWIYNAKEKKNTVGAMGTELEFEFPFPTALKNHTLPVYIKKTTPDIPVPGVAFWEFKVQGNKLNGADYDVPARNGALHVVEKVLNPLSHHDDVAAWDDWEDWLPAWAAEN